MITVKNLSFSYSQLPFIENMNFQVRSGEIFGFLGPSGAGKSTLQKILIGMLPKYKGSVSINNNEIRNKSDQFYESIGVDFEFPSFYEKFTALENLKFFGSLYDCKLIPVEQLLEMVGLSQHANKKVAGFSKGMKSRLNFARSIIHQPKVLFLDEPTTGLDMVYQEEIFRFSKALAEMGKTILMVVHELNLAAKYCSRIILLGEGTVIADGRPDNVFTEKILSKAYNAPVRVIRSHNTNEIIEISTKEDNGRCQRDKELNSSVAKVVYVKNFFYKFIVMFFCIMSDGFGRRHKFGSGFSL